MSRAERRSWVAHFLRNVLLWLVPIWGVWVLVTPFYNRVLLASAQNLLHATEHPSATQLLRQGDDDAVIARLEPPMGRLKRGFRVSDIHFHLVLLGALFLGVPRVPWRDRLAHLGWALLATVFFDVLVVFSRVKVAYATELGSWSLRHYGPWARNMYGLLHHLLDLPFKLSLPFALWAVVYLSLLLPVGITALGARSRERGSRDRKTTAAAGSRRARAGGGRHAS
jgi:hypothetical protein